MVDDICIFIQWILSEHKRTQSGHGVRREQTLSSYSCWVLGWSYKGHWSRSHFSRAPPAASCPRTLSLQLVRSTGVGPASLSAQPRHIGASPVEFCWDAKGNCQRTRRKKQTTKQRKGQVYGAWIIYPKGTEFLISVSLEGCFPKPQFSTHHPLPTMLLPLAATVLQVPRGRDRTFPGASQAILIRFQNLQAFSRADYLRDEPLSSPWPTPNLGRAGRQRCKGGSQAICLHI